MDDLISRQAAIRAVCERECQWLEPCGRGCKAILALKDLPSVQPDNDIIHLQKEQAYLQGWEEGREALRREIWEDGRDRLD